MNDVGTVGQRISVKICCIATIEEARTAIASGATAIGLVSAMPSGPGVISDAQIREISDAMSSQVDTFLLTSRTDSEDILQQHRRCATRTIQLVDTLSSASRVQIKSAIPDVRLVQVVHVVDENSIIEALDAARTSDALLLDSGNPALVRMELGGTGRTHDWQLSARIVDAVEVPVYLAGGLDANNVREAIRTVRPSGLDLCSAVRTNDQLDSRKLEQFMSTVGAASHSTGAAE
jgi:phosphoribosylanthranilate isomerase